MRYYPVNLDIRNRKCLVVGGGSVGSRKAMTLLDCGAKVTVVSTDVTEQLLKLADHGSIILKKRPYKTSDLDVKFLVVGKPCPDLVTDHPVVRQRFVDCILPPAAEERFGSEGVRGQSAVGQCPGVLACVVIVE